MTLSSINAFLVHPGKGVDSAPSIAGNKLPLSGKIFEMLGAIFHADADMKDFQITFKHAEDGAQQNDCRDLMITYGNDPSVANGALIAQRLQRVSDNRSGIGLLFLLKGMRGVHHRLIASRFPADQAILAEIGEEGLGVEFLEQVFIKRMSAYKAIMLDDAFSEKMFWSGMATDRQAGGLAENISRYWIDDFLNADFSETPAAGTRRLAEALKKALKSLSNVDAKAEITSAVTLASQVFNGKATSIAAFCRHFNFSDETSSMVQKQLSKASLFSKSFKFDGAEFKNKLPYRTDELSNGAMMTAPADKFNEIFEVSEKESGDFEYKTTAAVKDRKMASR